ncbi:hypothetical protein FBZ98_105126 [Rhizobium sp. ERR 922]|nr:hypothetical protein FBZ98_105126 [Rhizobium sp. ERR 922]TWB94068.1 hypothetical protein FBZ97_105126 [Rhizobium sp. ERR 942]
MGAGGKRAEKSGRKCSARSVLSASPQMGSANVLLTMRSAVGSDISN